MKTFFERIIANAKAARNKEQTGETNIIQRYENDKLVVGLTLSSKDYGWSTPDKSVKVMLTNPGACADSPDFSTWNIMGLITGTGHVEWEAILASALMDAVCKWKKNGANAEEAADISALFNRDLLAKQKMFKKEDISKHLNRIFNTEKVESDGTRFVSFKVA